MKSAAKPGAKRRSRPGVGIALAAIWLAGAAWLWPDQAAHLFHPARFATTGTARLPAETYITAVETRLGDDDPIDQLDLPAGRGPVVVTTAAARVWLDPPTAHVLDVAAVGEPDAALLAHPAQPLAKVIARARAVSPGQLRRVQWPGPGRPDWLVTIAAKRHETVLKVADDTDRAGAAAARTGQVLRLTPMAVVRWGWLLLPGVAGLVWMRRRR
jgi:hypothetical protein